MENAVEALKMAGAVLLFVIALSVAILAFTTSRESLDKIVKNADRETLTIENDSRFYYIANDNDVKEQSSREDRTKRYVGLETIIPTLYRTVEENFKVIFEFDDSSHFLYKKDGIGVKKIENEETTANTNNYIKLLEGIIYGFTDSYNRNTFNNKFNIEIPSNQNECLYNYISSKISNGYKILESLGTYYKEDVTEDGSVSDVPEINKLEKRVITYSFIND